VRQGLTIVARNFRTRFGEIDLIAQDGSTLSRRSASAAGTSRRARKHHGAKAQAAARGYLAMIGGEPACRSSTQS
jgi:Holliday junction resolvase-like predicted endonuclease